MYNRGFFEKIATRKLLLNMTGKKLSDLDHFRKNSMGLNYGLSPSVFLFKSKSEPKIGEESKEQYEVDPNRAFHCAELATKAFKVIDLLRDPFEQSSGAYVPGSFAKDCRIDKEMVDNVALGPELNILVNKDWDIEKDTFL